MKVYIEGIEHRILILECFMRARLLGAKPPSMRELQTLLGLHSTSGVFHSVKRLHELGALASRVVTHREAAMQRSRYSITDFGISLQRLTAKRKELKLGIGQASEKLRGLFAGMPSFACGLIETGEIRVNIDLAVAMLGE